VLIGAARQLAVLTDAGVVAVSGILAADERCRATGRSAVHRAGAPRAAADTRRRLAASHAGAIVAAADGGAVGAGRARRRGPATLGLVGRDAAGHADEVFVAADRVAERVCAAGHAIVRTGALRLAARDSRADERRRAADRILVVAAGLSPRAAHLLVVHRHAG